MELDAYLHLQPPDAVWTLALAQIFCQGILFIQTSTYFRQSQEVNDSRLHKAFIALCVGLNSLQTALLLYKSWCVVIVQGRWATNPMRTGELILNGLCTIAVQAFFIRRCWRISHSRIVAALQIAMTLLVLGANFYLTIVILSDQSMYFMQRASRDPAYGKYFLHSVQVAFGIYMGGSAALDTFITAILLLFLWRSRTGLAKLDTIVFRIINVSWESQALPMVFALIACVLFFLERYDFVLLFSGMTGKLYCHGLLRTLNVRTELRRRIIQEELHLPWLLDVPLGPHTRSKTASQAAAAPDAPDLELGATRASKVQQQQQNHQHQHQNPHPDPSSSAR